MGTNSTLVIPLGAYPCKDGWIAAGVITPREWDALAEWIHEVTGNDEVLSEAYRGGNQDRAEHIDIITALFLEFAENFTVQELFHEGQRRNLVFLPCQRNRRPARRPSTRRIRLLVRHRA